MHATKKRLKPFMKSYLSILITPARTHFISGLKSRVLKLTISALKMMVKSGLKFILKFAEPLQRYLLTCGIYADRKIPKIC